MILKKICHIFLTGFRVKPEKVTGYPPTGGSGAIASAHHSVFGQKINAVLVFKEPRPHSSHSIDHCVI